ncbi:hypothetical protein BDL97_09G066300 [Sphagnum fallax]|nr:hypothetical protein BDL97_09G066300 [Sphagnum fallax]
MAALTLTALLDHAAEQHGENLALIASGGPHLTHRELHGAIEKAAAQLRRAGVKPGDLVSLAFPNTLEFVVVFIAVTRVRAIAAPLNAAYTEDEFKFYLEDAGSTLLLVPGAEGNKAAEAAAAELNLPIAGVHWEKESGDVVIVPKSKIELAPELEDLAGPKPVDTDEALFLHTSGTTSRPKGVPLTQANLASSIQHIKAWYELSPSDRTLIVMPLFHVHGLMAALLSTLAAGGTAVLPAAGRFSASSFWKDIKTNSVTWYTAVPTIHQILLKVHKSHPEAEYPKLRFIRSCSSALAPAVLEDLQESFNAPVLEGYAMTEASHQMTSNPLPAHGPNKPGTVGKPTGIELAILNDNGEIQKPGVVGEVSIRGPNVTKGYRNNPDANKTAFEFGWFHTGDRGFVDEDGYLTLTGRIKELINRGGEKISPLEVDAVLLSHPAVSEAVAFGAPDAHFGEEVNAGIVLNKGANATEKDIQEFCKKNLAPFKIPKRIFFADELPRTATGKIQRRIVAEHFLKDTSKESTSEDINANKKAGALVDGNRLAARAFAKTGIEHMFGVVGIPVTSLASSCVTEGIRFIAFHNEQSAGYAAGAAGYLTGKPGLLLTVSGPGCVHGLAGLSNAMINTWPFILVSGSSVQADVGRGDFQELDQLEIVKPFSKYSGKAHKISEIPGVVSKAVASAVSGRPGGTYIDIPSDVLHETVTEEEAKQLLDGIEPYVPVWAVRAAPKELLAGDKEISEAVSLLRNAKKPLIVFGKGAAYSRAEKSLKQLVESTGIPFLATPMGKGLLPDSHPLSAAAARSLALAESDVALVVGARLNWLLHFGEPPKWSESVKFILADISEEEIKLRKPAVGLVGDANLILQQLLKEYKDEPFRLGEKHPWVTQIRAKAQANIQRMAVSLNKDVVPFNFLTPMRIVRDAILAVGSPAPILVSEGANTMDVGRSVLEQTEPRTRLDAGTWGTMGVGLGYAIAAAVVNPERLVVAVEGDSGFGFSGLEVETLVRYNLPVIVIIFNNNGVYGGDRRTPEEISGPHKDDPAPTSFVPEARYDLVMEAFGGKGYIVRTPKELESALKESFSARKPAVINIIVDPFAGSESGRMGHRN